MQQTKTSKRSSSVALLAIMGAVAGCTGTIAGSPDPGRGGGDDNRSGGNTGGNRNGGNTGGSLQGGSAQAPDCPSEILPFSFEAVRLTETQFRRTITQLFPFPIDVGTRFPASSPRFDFSSYVGANEVLYADLQNILETAEDIAMQAIARPADLFPCTPAGDGAACARQFLDGFLPRAYRRPADAADIDRLIELYRTVRANPDPLDFDLAMAAVLVTVLQSPKFLYRVEIGEPSGTPGILRLDDFEVASRLSYLFWDAPPDDGLLGRARDGQLGDRDAIAGEAARLLDDARARPAVARFFSEWMGASGMTFEDRVPALVSGSMAQELTRFVTDTVFDAAGDLDLLLTGGHTFVNRSLQQHYALPVTAANDSDWRRVDLPAGMHAGLLSKAQVAAAHSHTGETSVILRGDFVHDRLICVSLGVPPPGATGMNPELPPEATARERIEARGAIALCRGCHNSLDWAGYGMEDLDQVGRLRSTYRSNGTPVEATGALHQLDGEPTFTGTAELGALLAGRDDATGECLATQWYRFSTGHGETADEFSCHVGAMKRAFAESGYNLRALLLSIARSDAMLFRAEEN